MKTIDLASSSSSRHLLALLVGLGLTAAGPMGCGKDDNGDDDDVGIVADGGGDAGDTSGGGDDTGGGKMDTGVEQDTGPNQPVGEEKTVQSFAVMPTLPAKCGQTGRNYRLPFYFVSKEDQTPIREGDKVGGQVMRANETMGAGTLTARRTRVSQATSQTCTSSSDCQAPLKCGSSGVRGAARFCTRQTGIEFIPGTVKSDYSPGIAPDDKQLVTLLIEDTKSLEGALPQPVNTQYDENGEDDFGKKPGRATDPELKIREAAGKFALSLATANSEDNTKAGLWFFGGENKFAAQPLVNAQEREDHFQDDLALLGDLVDTQLGNTVAAPGNLYQAITQIVDRDFALDKYKDHEKFLVVLTDGPNEVYDTEATKDKVLAKLKENNVHLFMIHLDTPIDASQLRDVPSYWQGGRQCRMDDSCEGAPPCNEDSDCGNFEVCRKATLYAETADGEVTQTDQQYCMPDYGEDGQLGPIDEYAEMACETGGNYIYVDKPSQMSAFADRIPNTFDGQWSIEVDLSALDEKVGLPAGYYRLSGAFFGLLSPNLISRMSATGPHTTHTPDTRGLLRIGAGAQE